MNQNNHSEIEKIIKLNNNKSWITDLDGGTSNLNKFLLPKYTLYIHVFYAIVCDLDFYCMLHYCGPVPAKLSMYMLLKLLKISLWILTFTQIFAFPVYLTHMPNMKPKVQPTVDTGKHFI